MKKFLSIAIAAILFVACKKESPKENSSVTAKLRYEAIADDPSNYKLKLIYSKGNVVSNENLTQTESESPFKFENSIKTGANLYISAFLVAKNDVTTAKKGVTVRIYIDDKMVAEDSGEIAAAATIPLWNIVK